MSKLRNHLLATAAGAVLVIAVSNAALAQSFTLDPAAVVPGIAGGNVVANQLIPLVDSLTMFTSGNSSTPGSTFSESGVVQITGFSGCSGTSTQACEGLTNAGGLNGANGQPAAQYSLFLVFTASGSVTSPTSFNIATTNYTLYLDTNLTDQIATASNISLTTAPTFGQPLAGPGTPGFTPGTPADVYEVATGSLLQAGTVNVTNTPSFTESIDLSVVPVVAGFFVAPLNINIAMASFTNTTVVDCGISGTSDPSCASANQIALYEQGGAVTLAAVVPEPASMAIFGTALLGLGWARRRQSKTDKTA